MITLNWHAKKKKQITMTSFRSFVWSYHQLVSLWREQHRSYRAVRTANWRTKRSWQYSLDVLIKFCNTFLQLGPEEKEWGQLFVKCRQAKSKHSSAAWQTQKRSGTWEKLKNHRTRNLERERERGGGGGRRRDRGAKDATFALATVHADSQDPSSFAQHASESSHPFAACA